jgi:hypothetical protein
MTSGPGNRRVKVVASFLIVAVALGAIGIAAFFINSGSTAEATDVDPRVSAVLSVFDGPRSAGDDLAFDPATDGTGDIQPGERPDLSRRIELGQDREAFVWPRDAGVCFASPGGNGCVPIELIRDKGITVGSQQKIDTVAGRFTDVQTFGIARDGIDRVVLHFEGGSRVSTAVLDNAFFVADGNDIPTSISWTDESGYHQVETGTESPAAMLRSIRRAHQNQR